MLHATMGRWARKRRSREGEVEVSDDLRRLISIVVPVLNEEQNVRALYEALVAVAENEPGYDFEFVFTDNRSTDQTFDVLRELAEHDVRVRAFRFAKNFGFQRSIFTGCMIARGAAVVQIDCDLQDPPELIHEFLRKWEAGYQVVYGVRRGRAEGLPMATFRKLSYRFIDALSEDRLPADAGDFRLIDRKVVDGLSGLQDPRPYLRGLIAGMGFSQTGIPYDRKAREAGTSKFPLSKVIALGLDGILSHSTVPLRLATFAGLLSGGAMVVMAGRYLFLWFQERPDWPPGFATISLLLMFSITINCLLLGILGEYLGRIFQRGTNGPLALIDEAIDAPSHVASSRDRDPTHSGVKSVDAGSGGAPPESPTHSPPTTETSK